MFFYELYDVYCFLGYVFHIEGNKMYGTCPRTQGKVEGGKQSIIRPKIRLSSRA